MQMMLNRDRHSLGRYALGEDETIISSLKADLGRGLILRTVIATQVSEMCSHI